MINEDSVRAVEDAYFDRDFVRPMYETYCFARIPHLVQRLFEEDGGEDAQRLLATSGPYDTVILLLVDGFGWELLQRYRDRYPFLGRFFHEGLVTKLTSEFPSTTSVHLTSMHTGLTPAESGIYEWFVYEPMLDTVIQTLPFAEIGNRTPGSLLAQGISPWDVFPDASIHRALSRRGVRTSIFQNRAFTPSPFGEVVMQGAQLRPFRGLEDGLRDLADEITLPAGKRFLYLYSGDVDTAGHHHGPESREFGEQVDATFTLLERYLMPALARAPNRTLLLVTADHGHIAVDPNATIALNRILPAAETWLRASPAGRPMLPAGHARDVVLFIRPGHLEEARGLLAERLADLAEVWPVRDMIADGYFGSTDPSPAFMERMGELMVLPHDNHMIWWGAPHYRLLPFRGSHGGLTRAEMETELMSLEP